MQNTVTTETLLKKLNKRNQFCFIDGNTGENVCFFQQNHSLFKKVQNQPYEYLSFQEMKDYLLKTTKYAN